MSWDKPQREKTTYRIADRVQNPMLIISRNASAIQDSQFLWLKMRSYTMGISQKRHPRCRPAVRALLIAFVNAYSLRHELAIRAVICGVLGSNTPR